MPRMISCAPAGLPDQALVNVNAQHADGAEMGGQRQGNHALIAADVQALAVLEPRLFHYLHSNS